MIDIIIYFAMFIFVLLIFFVGRNYGFDNGYYQGWKDGTIEGAEQFWNELSNTKKEHKYGD